MALAIGTNCGFVESAPSADPDEDYGSTINGYPIVSKDTSPATGVKITEIGMWINSSDADITLQLGLYAADGSVVPGEAGTLLYSDTTTTGTSGAWRTISVDWAISPSTDYWLGCSVPSGNNSYMNYTNSGGAGEDYATGDSLPDPFNGGAIYAANGMVALYAVWEAAGGANPRGPLGLPIIGPLGGMI